MKIGQGKEVKRLGIYVFYDRDGVVDRYVLYQLNDLKKNCQEILVVCNGKLTREGRAALESVPAKVFVRENKGFDFWAYREGLLLYGWEKLAEYDEVLLMNATLFGPLYPFSEVFEAMNARDLDFWGLTKHYKIPFDPFGTTGLGYVPEHIQSCFLCVRQRMLCSDEFKRFWEDLPPLDEYKDAVGKCETIFTKKFNDAGFVSDAYVKTDDLEDYTNYPLIFEAKELVANRRCPVFKRRMFFHDYYFALANSAGEETVRLFDYIAENLDYDLDMVWENLLRTCNMADLKNRLHLNYVFSSQTASDDAHRQIKSALVMHLYFDDLIDSSMRYADAMPEESDIYFTVCTEKMQTLVQEAAKALAPRKVAVIRMENRGRDVSSLLVAAAPYVFDYDVVCFAHDKKSGQTKPITIGQSFAYKCLENVLGSRAYTKNILSAFAHNPRLGMLMPPPPNHAALFGSIGNEWTTNFDNVAALAKELELHVDIDPQKEPVSPLGTMFWFRPDALKPLYDKGWAYEDFPEEPNGCDGTLLHAIERIYGFVAQSQGYFAGWAMNDRFAAIELTNLHFMLRELTRATRGNTQYFDDFYSRVELVKQCEGMGRPFRIELKERIKRKVPRPIWGVSKRIYHLFGGKKWVG